MCKCQIDVPARCHWQWILHRYWIHWWNISFIHYWFVYIRSHRHKICTASVRHTCTFYILHCSNVVYQRWTVTLCWLILQIIRVNDFSLRTDKRTVKIMKVGIPHSESEPLTFWRFESHLDDSKMVWNCKSQLIDFLTLTPVQLIQFDFF